MTSTTLGRVWLGLAVLALALVAFAVYSARYVPVGFLWGGDGEAPCVVGVLVGSTQTETLFPGAPAEGGFCLVFDRWTGKTVWRPVDEGG